MIRLIDIYKILKSSISDDNNIIIGIEDRYVPDIMVHCYEHFPIKKMEYLEMFDGSISCMVCLSGLTINGCTSPNIRPIKFGELETILIHDRTPIVPINELHRTIYWNWEFDESIRDKDVKRVNPLLTSACPTIQVFID